MTAVKEGEALEERHIGGEILEKSYRRTHTGAKTMGSLRISHGFSQSIWVAISGFAANSIIDPTGFGLFL